MNKLIDKIFCIETMLLKTNKPYKNEENYEL